MGIGVDGLLGGEEQGGGGGGGDKGGAIAIAGRVSLLCFVFVVEGGEEEVMAEEGEERRVFECGFLVRKLIESSVGALSRPRLTSDSIFVVVVVIIVSTEDDETNSSKAVAR